MLKYVKTKLNKLKTFNICAWPPRSPDLNPCDFYLWGYLKNRANLPMPKSILELKAIIAREMKNIVFRVQRMLLHKLDTKKIFRPDMEI
jgi:hypothetical protein